MLVATLTASENRDPSKGLGIVMWRFLSASTCLGGPLNSLKTRLAREICVESLPDRLHMSSWGPDSSDNVYCEGP